MHYFLDMQTDCNSESSFALSFRQTDGDKQLLDGAQKAYSTVLISYLINCGVGVILYGFACGTISPLKCQWTLNPCNLF